MTPVVWVESEHDRVIGGYLHDMSMRASVRIRPYERSAAGAAQSGSKVVVAPLPARGKPCVGTALLRNV